MKKAEIIKPFLEMAERILYPLNYKKQKSNEGYEYILYIEDGFFIIFPTIYQYDKLFYISLGFSLRINAVSKILAIINNVREEVINEYTTLSFGIDSLIDIEDNRIKVENPQELENALRILKSILQNEMIDALHNIKTVNVLDKEINRENRPANLYCSEISKRPFIGLTSAVLNQNSDVKYWENYYREKLINANQHLKNQYENLIDYLKKNYSEAFV